MAVKAQVQNVSLDLNTAFPDIINQNAQNLADKDIEIYEELKGIIDDNEADIEDKISKHQLSNNAHVASKITNDSNVSGSSILDALNTLLSAIEAHYSNPSAHLASKISNDTTLAGAKLSNVLLSLSGRIDNIVAQSGTDNTEVVDARLSAFKDVLFFTLNARLNSIERSNNFIDPRDYGASATGSSKKLSAEYETLEDAQVNFPMAQSLNDELDTVVLEKLFNSLPAGSNVKIEGIYLISRQVNIPTTLNVFGSGKLKFASDYVKVNNTLKMFHITALSVNFGNICFDTDVLEGNGGTVNNVYLWFAAGSGLSMIQGCKFKDLPSDGNNFNGAIAHLAGGSGRNIWIGNVFERCPGSIFTQQANDICLGNTSLNPKDVCYVANGPGAKKMIVAFNNVITNTNQGAAARITAEQGAPEMIVVGNTLDGICEGFAIGFDSVEDTTVGSNGIIAYNIINGGNLTSTGYTSGLVIRGYYTGVKVFGNVIKNIVSGANNCAVLLETGGDIEFYDNTIEATTGSAGRNMVIMPKVNSGTIRIKRNRFKQVSAGIGIMFGSGTITSTKVYVENNDFIDGAEGIQTINLGGSDMSTIGDFVAKDNTFTNVSAPTNWTNLFGAWAQSQMYSVHKYSHHLSKGYKKLYGTSMPTSGSWTAKDEVINATPSVIAAHLREYFIYGWKRITTGSGNTLNVDWVEMRIETRSYVDVWWRFRLTRVSGGFTMQLVTTDNRCASHGVDNTVSPTFTTSVSQENIDWVTVGEGTSLIKYGLAGQDYFCVTPPFDVQYMLCAYPTWHNTSLVFNIDTRKQVGGNYFVISFKKPDGADYNMMALPEGSYIEFSVGFNVKGW